LVIHRYFKSSSLCFLLCALVVLLSAGPAARASGQDSPRKLETADILRKRSVGAPQVSPDGKWIAYTVTTSDLEEDDSTTRIWMVSMEGGESIPLTAAEDSSWHPRWSPDGKYLGFLSNRGDDETTQVWTLFRGGGEAVQRTDTAQGVGATVWYNDGSENAGSFVWSPDGSKLLLVLKDASPQELEKKSQGEDYEEGTPPPWVITRQQFRIDYQDYLDERYTHIYTFDLESGDLTQITSGQSDDFHPAWSPDGSEVAFVSNRTDNPDANYDTNIWVVAADNTDRGAHPRQITTNPGPDKQPVWSPDGRWIAHISAIDTAALLYATNHLAVSSARGGDMRVLTEEIDRWASEPQFSDDGTSIYFLLEDAGRLELARVAVTGGAIQRLLSGPRVVDAFDLAPDDRNVALLIGDPHRPGEIFLIDNGELQPRTRVNEELFSRIELGEVEKLVTSSADGTPIEYFVTKPPDFQQSRKYPTILYLHGGPQSQYDYRFDFEAQLWAAHGYLVVMPNPRGSTGYGQEFCMGIWQDWGGPDFEDVMASVDAVIDRGWADPERLAVTGWSYGGMLTNHVITKTHRFDAAITGASAALYVVNYGHDMYQRWWEFELGLPWEPESRELYERISPFNRVQNVTTPTLIIGGEVDWNVPIINSEQLFIALKRLGVETELVVYPDEYHGIDTPSHELDLLQRYLDWFDRFLKTESQPEAEP